MQERITDGLRRISEHHLLSNAVRLGSGRYGLDTPFPPEIVKLDALNDAIAECLHDPFLSEHVDIFDNQALPNSDGFGAVLRRQIKDGKSQSITFYRLKDTWVRDSLLLLGATIGVVIATPAATVPAATLVKNLFSNLLTLRRDANAGELLDAYDALLNAIVSVGSGPWPSTLQIQTLNSSMSLADITASLRRLKDLDLIEVNEWGDGCLDFEHPENRWKPKL